MEMCMSNETNFYLILYCNNFRTSYSSLSQPAWKQYFQKEKLQAFQHSLDRINYGMCLFPFDLFKVDVKIISQWQQLILITGSS